MPFQALRATGAALALGLASLASFAASERGAFPQMALPEMGAAGQRAIDLLGPRLDAVAAWYRQSPQEFRAMLLRDPLMRLDRQGRLFVVDTLDKPLPPAPDQGVQADGPKTALAPLDQTFLLHSRPGAQRTIYLDFDGATLEGTAWNSGGNTITAIAYDFDGNPDAFSDAELERIQYIWQRVAEDYAPFDIDVTTEKPPGKALTRKDAADQIFGTTVLITNHNGVYDCSCGGVAYVGVFDNVGDFYKPALVFWDMLGSGNEKYVAEAISHEAGHNVGLSHDGYSGGGYYPGHGEGETGWAPIMGVGYYQSLVQWSQGEYATANNKQDDFVVIGQNGGPLRPDDHGDTGATATPMTTTPNGPNLAVSAAGVIERRTDRDYFSFTAGAGAVELAVAPDARSANLDVSLKLLDGAGAVVAKAKPNSILAATLSATLPTGGTYYLVVDGTGLGKPLETGYSDYGSLGQYTVTGSVPAP
jgi:hypothetical protein